MMSFGYLKKEYYELHGKWLAQSDKIKEKEREHMVDREAVKHDKEACVGTFQSNIPKHVKDKNKRKQMSVK